MSFEEDAGEEAGPMVNTARRVLDSMKYIPKVRGDDKKHSLNDILPEARLDLSYKMHIFYH